MTSEARGIKHASSLTRRPCGRARLTRNGGSIWPSSLPAKRRRGPLASAAITVRSDAEAAVNSRDEKLMKLIYHMNVMN
eukprot:2814608-Pleurochrysis_carterae.AAC.1